MASKLKITIIIVVLLGLLISGSIYFYQFETKKLVAKYKQIEDLTSDLEWCNGWQKMCEKERDELKIENEELKIRISNLGLTVVQRLKSAKYIDNEFKISFDYPEYWGPIVKDTSSIPAFLTFSGTGSKNALFLTAINKDTILPARGGFWGDAGVNIDNESYIKNYCNNKENCSVFTNKNGVLIAKHIFIDVSEGEESDVATAQYYFYNPNSEFNGFVMSYVRIPDWNIIDGIDKKFEDIVKSVKFL
ncbi:MAG: hypothetical protein WC310_01475 [Patescibacteria group bacterium]|jgi:hypothetical protein